MSDLLTQLELADTRDRETQFMERMVTKILRSSRSKQEREPTKMFAWNMPVALRAVLFEQAERHGITITDILNQIAWDFVPTMRHSEPMKGRIVPEADIDRRTRGARKRRQASK